MIYKRAYSEWLFEEIKKGKKIYVLDKKFVNVVIVNELTVDQLVALMRSDVEEETRYEFWYEEEKKVTEEEDDE